jgi:hypothetical protein
MPVHDNCNANTDSDTYLGNIYTTTRIVRGIIFKRSDDFEALRPPGRTALLGLIPLAERSDKIRHLYPWQSHLKKQIADFCVDRVKSEIEEAEYTSAKGVEAEYEGKEVLDEPNTMVEWISQKLAMIKDCAEDEDAEFLLLVNKEKFALQKAKEDIAGESDDVHKRTVKTTN